jgi:hypothetical protein
MLVAANLCTGRVKAQEAQEDINFVCRGCCGPVDICEYKDLLLFFHTEEDADCSSWFTDRPFSYHRIMIQNLFPCQNIDVCDTLENGDFIKTDLLTLNGHVMEIVGKNWLPSQTFTDIRHRRFKNILWVLCDITPLFFGEQFVVCRLCPSLHSNFCGKYTPVFIWLPSGFYRIYMWGKSHVMAQHIPNNIMLLRIFGLEPTELVNKTLFPEPHRANTDIKMTTSMKHFFVSSNLYQKCY